MGLLVSFGKFITFLGGRGLGKNWGGEDDVTG